MAQVCIWAMSPCCGASEALLYFWMGQRELWKVSLVLSMGKSLPHDNVTAHNSRGYDCGSHEISVQHLWQASHGISEGPGEFYKELHEPLF